MKTLIRAAVLASVALTALVRCTDPIPDRVVEAQGEELPGFPEGEYHRPGQVCTACHKTDGTAKSVFTVAGTIFSGPNDLRGVHNAEVQLTDSVGTQHIALTNCVGNFFVKPDEWEPKFPILVRVRKGTTAVTMKGPIGREGSCNACHLSHRLGPGEFHRAMPHVSIFGGPEPEPTAPDGGCGVDAHVDDLPPEILP